MAYIDDSVVEKFVKEEYEKKIEQLRRQVIFWEDSRNYWEQSSDFWKDKSVKYEKDIETLNAKICELAGELNKKEYEIQELKKRIIPQNDTEKELQRCARDRYELREDVQSLAAEANKLRNQETMLYTRHREHLREINWLKTDLKFWKNRALNSMEKIKLGEGGE